MASWPPGTKQGGDLNICVMLLNFPSERIRQASCRQGVRILVTDDSVIMSHLLNLCVP